MRSWILSFLFIFVSGWKHGMHTLVWCRFSAEHLYQLRHPLSFPRLAPWKPLIEKRKLQWICEAGCTILLRLHTTEAASLTSDDFKHLADIGVLSSQIVWEMKCCDKWIEKKRKGNQLLWLVCMFAQRWWQICPAAFKIAWTFCLIPYLVVKHFYSSWYFNNVFYAVLRLFLMVHGSGPCSN